MKKSFQLRMYEIIADPPEGDKLGNFVNSSILLLIAVNIIIGILETIEVLGDSYPEFFYWFEFVSVMIFSVEYIIRLWACPASEEFQGSIRGRLKLTFKPMPLVDLFAILPFYLQSFIPGLDLRVIRVLRLLRLFRLFRVGRFAESFAMLGGVVKGKKEELIISVMVLAIMLIMSSSLMFLAEGNVQKDLFKIDSQAQYLKGLSEKKLDPGLRKHFKANQIELSKEIFINAVKPGTLWSIRDQESDQKYFVHKLEEGNQLKITVRDTQFTSVPASMWWGIITITTIGYGDMYPMTDIGRVLGAIVGFLGICVFALPVAILGGGFMEEMERQEKRKQEALLASGGKPAVSQERIDELELMIGRQTMELEKLRAKFSEYEKKDDGEAAPTT